MHDFLLGFGIGLLLFAALVLVGALSIQLAMRRAAVVLRSDVKVRDNRIVAAAVFGALGVAALVLGGLL